MRPATQHAQMNCRGKYQKTLSSLERTMVDLKGWVDVGVKQVHGEDSGTIDLTLQSGGEAEAQEEAHAFLDIPLQRCFSAPAPTAGEQWDILMH